MANNPHQLPGGENFLPISIGLLARETLEVYDETKIVIEDDQTIEEDIENSRKRRRFSRTAAAATARAAASLGSNAITATTLSFEGGLEETTVSPKKMKSSIWFNVQDPIKSFCGRETFLHQLHTTIQSTQGRQHNTITILSQFKVLTGLGGVGKTETARMYIQKYSHFYDNNVVWINAENENSMRDSFYNLAEQKLGVTTTQANGRPIKLDTILKEIYAIICQRKVLIIFDNADGGGAESNPTDGIKQFLPPSASSVTTQPFILVTSRDQEWACLDSNIVMLNLDVFTVDESVHFILKQLDLDLTSESHQKDAQELGELLGHLPLALQQAVAYIIEERQPNDDTNGGDDGGAKFGIQNYITEYNMEKIKTKFFTCPPFDRPTEMAVYTTWNVTLNKIERIQHGPLAVDIIQVLSFLSPDNIPANLVYKLFASRVPEEDIKKSFKLLERYAMIKHYAPPSIAQAHTQISSTATTTTPPSRRLSIHRQVQHVILESLRSENKISKLLDALIAPSYKILDEMKPAIEFYKDSLNCMVSLVSHTNLVENLKERMPKSNFKGTLATHLSRVGNSKTALLLNGQLHEDLEKELGPDHPDTLDSLSNTGHFYHDQGDYTQALAVHKKVHEKELSIFGQNHEKTMQTLGNIGSVLDALGQYEESIKFLEQAYQFRVTKLGPRDPQSMATRHNLLIALQNSGANDKAVEVGESLCADRKSIFGAHHEDTLSSQNVLAVTYYHMDRVDDALALYKQIYDAQLQTLGPDHPHTLRTILNQTTILLNQDRFEEAQPLFEQLVEKFGATLGPEHPNTLDAQLNVAIALQNQNLFDQALALYLKVFGLLHKILGADHEKTSFAQDRIATMYQKLGSLQEAELNWKQVYQWRLQNLGSGHPKTWKTMENLSALCLDQNRLEEATQIIRQIYDAQLTKLGPDHSDSLRTLSNIAVGLYMMKKYEEALPIFEKVYEKRVQILGPTHPDTMSTLQRIVKIFDKARWLELGVQFLEKVFTNLRTTQVGISGEEITYIFHLLSIFLRQVQNLEKLSLLYDSVLKEQQAKIGIDCEEALCTKHNLGMLKKKMGQPLEALQLLEEVRKSREMNLGVENPATIYVQHDLAMVFKKLGRLDKAMEVMTGVIKMADKVYGTEAEFTLAAKHNLVSILRCAEKNEEALQLACDEVLVQEMDKLGPDHPDTLATQFNIALLSGRKGEGEKMREMMTHVYEKRKEILGQEHPKTVRVKNILDQ